METSKGPTMFTLWFKSFIFLQQQSFSSSSNRFVDSPFRLHDLNYEAWISPGLCPPLLVPQSSTHFLLWLHCSVCAKCSRLPLVERIVYSADHGQPSKGIPLEMCGMVLQFISLKTAWITGPRVNLDKFERKLLIFHLDCEKCLYRALYD